MKNSFGRLAMAAFLLTAGMSGNYGVQHRDKQEISTGRNRKSDHGKGRRNKRGYSGLHKTFGTFRPIKPVYGLKMKWDAK